MKGADLRPREVDYMLATGHTLDRSQDHHDLHTLPSLKLWSRYCACALFLQLINFDWSVSIAQEVPRVAQVNESIQKLRQASHRVQGKFQVFRSETVILEALEKAPTELQIPLVRQGKVWRGPGRFRADFKSLKQIKGVTQESQQAVALSDGQVYEFSGNLSRPDAAMLRIYEKETPEAVSTMKFMQAAFFDPLDSLWSSGGMSFTDLLQRPGSRIEASAEGGYSITASAEDGTKARFEFEATQDHPLRYYSTSVGGAKRGHSTLLTIPRLGG